MAFGTKGTLLAGVLSALGASACCAGPLILLLLGVGGGWASHLVALEAYRPYFTALTHLFLGLAFYTLYVRRPICQPAKACAVDHVIRNQRRLFWCAEISVTLLLTFPLYASLFY